MRASQAYSRTVYPTAGEPDDVGDLAAGVAAWSRCEVLTAGLAGELAEQLRLILEPTVASRLAGDYRSGVRPVCRAPNAVLPAARGHHSRAVGSTGWCGDRPLPAAFVG